MRPHGDAFGFQRAQGDGPRGNDADGNPAAEVPAAATVLEAPVFGGSGPVGVRGTRQFLQGIVVGATHIGVGNEDANRRTGGQPVLYPAHDAVGVRFPAGGIGKARRAAALQLPGDEGLVDAEARCHPVQDSADVAAVRLPRKGEDNACTYAVFHPR